MAEIELNSKNLKSEQMIWGNLIFSNLTIGIAAAVAIVEANDMDRITVGH